MSEIERAVPDSVPAVPDSPASGRRDGPHEYVVDGHLVDDTEDDDELSRAAARAVLAVAYRLGRGHIVLARRAADALTHAHVREQVRDARATGDTAALGEWVDRLEAGKDARQRRIQALPSVLLGGAIAAFALVAAAGAVLLILGTVVGLAHPLGWTWGGYWRLWAMVLRVALAAVVIALWVGVPAVPVLWLAAVYRAGRTLGPVPGWLAAPAEREDETAIVTPAGVAEALVHLGVPTLSRAVREGWTVQFATPPVRVNGRGYQTVFSLPMGVTPDMVADRRKVLARNLHRDPLEVWPAAAERAGFVDLWVANAGTSKRPAPEYPLLHEGSGDVFAGIPVGVTQRGDVLSFPLVGANFSAGGRMGQGKSNLCRVVMLGAALDPLARLRVHVFAGNGDFDAYEPRLEVYNHGTNESVVLAGLEELRWLYEETGRREDRIAEIGAKKVTRAVAERHPDLRPIVALFSECHELFGCTDPLDPDGPKSETVGKIATDYAAKALRRARKTGIVLGFDTQQARVDAIPPKIIGLVGINACFSIKSWRDNDGFLGDGSFAAGIRATELRFNVDRGTCLVTGATNEVFEVVKTFFVAVDDDAGWDAATDVIARAMETYQASPAATPSLEPAEERDLLDDLDEVLGTDIVPIADVPRRLRELAPHWAPYRNLTGARLRELLADEGVKVSSTGNRWPLDPAAVRLEIARRSGE